MLAVLLVLLAGCSGSNDGSLNADNLDGSPAADNLDGSPESDNLSDSIRDVRYCEYLAIEPTDEGIIATAWNSFGLHDCPAQEWDAVDEEDLERYADDLGVAAVTKNGPRFWLMDELLSNRGKYEEIRFFDNLEMGLAAQVLLGATPSSDPYSERSVERDTLFTFNEGSEIYQLSGPAGREYVMQSYSHIVDDTQTSDSLSELESRLALPEGWTFTARVLEEDLFVRDVEGIATVVQDDLTNTYQRAVTLENSQ